MCAPNIVDRCPPETSSAKQDAGNGGRVRPRGVFCCERPLRAISVRPLLPEETSFAAVLSGKTVFSPEETSFFIYDDIR